MSVNPRARKATTRTKKNGKQATRLVSFNWGGRDYMLDLKKNQVYQNFMAVETNRGVAILGAYRSQEG
jgi:hypothetical protein